MSAYFETGFSVRKPMWHGGGLVLDEYPEDWSDARVSAGLTWEPQERPAFILRPTSAFRSCRVCTAGNGGTHDDGCLIGDLGEDHRRVAFEDCLPLDSVATEAGVFVRLLDHKLITRSDTDAVLSVVSDDFTSIYHGADQGASMEHVLDALKSADSNLRFETAGSLKGGRHVWALVYLDEPFTIAGDSTEHLPFAALLNSHDGSGAMKLIRTMVRIVCWNTWQMASTEAAQSGMELTFRHSGDVQARIDEALATIQGLRREVDKYKALAADLTDLRVDDERVSMFLSEFIPSPRENGEVISDRVAGNVDRARKLFKSIYTDSITTEGVRGTAFGLLQTSTEYLDHARAFRSPDSYMGRSILRPEPAKAEALRIIRRVCK